LGDEERSLSVVVATAAAARRAVGVSRAIGGRPARSRSTKKREKQKKGKRGAREKRREIETRAEKWNEMYTAAAGDVQKNTRARLGGRPV
jgi:hypothetical protein